MATANAIRAPTTSGSPRSASRSASPACSRTSATSARSTRPRAAEHLGQGRAATGAQVDRLAALGLVERQPDPDRSPGVARGDHRRRALDSRSSIAEVDAVLRGELRAGITRAERQTLAATARPTPAQPRIARPTSSTTSNKEYSTMTNAVIVDAVRTPGGKRNGKLKDWHPADLAAHVLKALQERNDLDPAHRRRRHHGMRHAGRRAVAQHRPQRRARRRLARVGAGHHGRPSVRVEPAGDALRRAGRDRRRLRRRRRRRRRGDDPHADGCVDRQGHGLPVPAVDARPVRRVRSAAAGHRRRDDRRRVRHHPRRPRRVRRREPAPRRAGHRRRPLRERDRARARRDRRQDRDDDRRRGHPRGHHAPRRSPTSSRRSRKTARSPPATRRRSATAPRPC